VGNVGVLSRFAEAAGALDFDQVQIRYLLEAQTILPSNEEIVRALSRALTRQGRFEEALTSWHELLELRPGDAEATRATHDIENAPGKPTALEEKLKTGQTAGGDDLESVEAREELQLARLRHRLAIAQRRAVADSDRKAQRLVSDFENECLRLEIEIFHLRCERFPGDSSVRLELARRLKQAGNFSGAIQRLEEADRLRPYDPPVLLELGECWQHLRQFAKALDSYRAAIANSPAQSNVWMLALYRAGVLTAAMGKFSEARSHFEALVAVQPDYKDARARLDNLPAN
jgi:tetratricopeptide (TPR) repeat protein